jgi:membrane protein involved in colicin uptake
MPVCAGIKRSGGRCTVSVGAGQTYCHHHDPARAQERSRAASRAARSKPGREIAQIKAALDDLYDAVESGQISPGVGAILNQITNSKLRSIEVGRKVAEADGYLARIESLELRLQSYGG